MAYYRIPQVGDSRGDWACPPDIDDDEDFQAYLDELYDDREEDLDEDIKWEIFREWMANSDQRLIEHHHDAYLARYRGD
jgi:hypothetical protein